MTSVLLVRIVFVCFDKAKDLDSRAHDHEDEMLTNFLDLSFNRRLRNKSSFILTLNLLFHSDLRCQNLVVDSLDREEDSNSWVPVLV